MKILGHILHGLATALSAVFNFIINVIELFVILFEGIKQLIVGVFIFGCMSVLIFPIWIFAIPTELLVFVAIVMIFPILGTKFVSLLRYVNYVLTEWLYDRADNLITNNHKAKKTMGEYSSQYKAEEERRRRRQEEQERQRQRDQWNRNFEEFWRNFGNSGGSYQQNSQGYYQNYNAGSSFTEKYEKSCDILNVPYDADRYQIKLNYRKLAKKYHPDINKADDAKEKFQEVNEAYEFLSDDNIQRYKSLHK